MKRLIVTECKRAVFSSGMALSLLVGIGVVLWHQYQYVWNPQIEQYNIFCPESLFYRWLGASCFPMQSYLYYLILPILACLPAGASYCEDLHTGYYKNLYIRNKKKEYLAAKYISVFVSGGLAVTIPLLVSLYLTAMRFPALAPEPIMYFGPNRRCVGFDLYYRSPMLHTALFLLIDFIFAGGIAGISLTATLFTSYRFAALVTPFICYYVVFSLDNLCRGVTFAPNYFLIPGYEKNNIWEFLIGIMIFLITAVIYYRRGKKIE